VDTHALTLGLKQFDRTKVDLDLGNVVDERHVKTPIRGPGSKWTEHRAKAL
jgi:hypothetical protein